MVNVHRLRVAVGNENGVEVLIGFRFRIFHLRAIRICADLCRRTYKRPVATVSFCSSGVKRYFGVHGALGQWGEECGSYGQCCVEPVLCIIRSVESTERVVVECIDRVRIRAVLDRSCLHQRQRILAERNAEINTVGVLGVLFAIDKPRTLQTIVVVERNGVHKRNNDFCQIYVSDTAARCT